MKKYYLVAALFAGTFLFSQNVGINTEHPHPSAILEVSADPAPNSGITTKKGLLPPRISLTSITQQIGAKANALGLMIYNLAEGGTFPDNFVANRYYFWNGSRWIGMPVQGYVDEATKPQVFYIQGTDTQTIALADINDSNTNTNANSKRVLITFSGTPLVNVGKIVTFEDATDSFKINFTGNYDISSFVNYNPQNLNAAYTNLYVQKWNPATGSWTDIGGSRTAWGNGAGAQIKTAMTNSLTFSFVKDDRIRFMIGNAFTVRNHGTNGNLPFIAPSSTSPVSKGVRIQFLEFYVP